MASLACVSLLELNLLDMGAGKKWLLASLAFGFFSMCELPGAESSIDLGAGRK